jgi:hypothetical protein
LISSRKPDDTPTFNQKMIEEFAEGSQIRRGCLTIDLLEHQTAQQEQS